MGVWDIYLGPLRDVLKQPALLQREWRLWIAISIEHLYSERVIVSISNDIVTDPFLCRSCLIKAERLLIRQPTQQSSRWKALFGISRNFLSAFLISWLQIIKKTNVVPNFQSFDWSLNLIFLYLIWTYYLFLRKPLISEASLKDSNLVDPASSHMLVLKIKPCMSKYK